VKDNFSNHSADYATYRPGYPDELFEFLIRFVQKKECAWDVGTGNGQIAQHLAKTFAKVYATDISQSQIDNAARADNIFYSVQPAEHTNFSDSQFDLVVAGQAVHWFDFSSFYSEVRRTACSNAVIALVGYNRPRISADIDELVDHFYHQVIGNYWDPERNYIDEEYQTIPFPFDEIPAPTMRSAYSWTVENFMGYLNTWSAVKHFTANKGFNPTLQLDKQLRESWGAVEHRDVSFPLLLRIGRL